MDDRRHSQRIPLDAPCLLALFVNDREECPAMVVDVSRGGVQLALPPNSSVEKMEMGTPLVLKKVSLPLDQLLENVRGDLAWVGTRCCGIKLNEDLPIAASDITDLARL